MFGRASADEDRHHGTSSMSLNDRFSKNKPIIVPAAKQVVRPSRKSLLTAGRLTQSRSNLAVVDDDYEDGLVDEEMMEEEIYDPTYAAVRRTCNPVIQRHRMSTVFQPVPLQDRISLAPQPYRVAPYNNGYIHVGNRGRAGFRANYRTQNGFRYNPNYGRLNGGIQSQNRYQNGGFPPRYGTRGGRGGARGGFQKKMQPKHTPVSDRESIAGPLSNASIHMKFASKKGAIAFCEKNNWGFEVEPHERQIKPKSYGWNYSWNKRCRNSIK